MSEADNITDNGQDGAPAPTDTDVPSEALWNRNHPKHQLAVEQNLYRVGQTDLADDMKAEREKAEERSKPLETPDFIGPEIEGELGDVSVDADSNADVADKPDLSGVSIVAGQPKHQADMETAMAGIPEPAARDLADAFERAWHEGAPSRADTEARLAQELGSREAAQETIRKAQSVIAKLPNAKTLIRALETTGAGNDPAIVRKVARLADNA